MIPRKPRSVPQAEAAAAASRGEVVVYWRPRCPYTLRLRSVLGPRIGEANWVNIWEDPDGAAYVRSVNNGDEVVPTVVIAGTARTNPPPQEVVAALDARRTTTQG